MMHRAFPMAAVRRRVTSVAANSIAGGAGGLSAAGAAPTVTGTARVVTIGSGNSGKLNVQAIGGPGTMEWRQGAGAWADASVTTERTFTGGTEVQFRATGLAAFDIQTCEVWDTDTATKLDDVSMEAV